MQRQQEGLEVKIQRYHAENIPQSSMLGKNHHRLQFWLPRLNYYDKVDWYR